MVFPISRFRTSNSSEGLLFRSQEWLRVGGEGDGTGLYCTEKEVESVDMCYERCLYSYSYVNQICDLAVDKAIEYSTIESVSQYVETYSHVLCMLHLSSLLFVAGLAINIPKTLLPYCITKVSERSRGVELLPRVALVSIRNR